MTLQSEFAFDLRHGTATWVPAEVGRGCSERPGAVQDAVQYQGVSPRMMNRVLSCLPLAARTSTFIDYGCGKGRALMLALQAGFQNVVGVEFDPCLANLAQVNLARARRLSIKGKVRIEVVDAAGFSPPPGPLVGFLYNPFGGDTLRRVARRLSRHASKFPVWIAYINPVHLEEFRSEGFVVTATWSHREGLGAAILSSDDGSTAYRNSLDFQTGSDRGHPKT